MTAAGIYDTALIERVRFAASAPEASAEEAKRLTANAVMVVAANTLATETDDLGRIEAALGGRYAGAFHEMPAHTPRPAVVAAADAARAVDADLIVSLGGGSVIDGVKAVQLCLVEGISDPADLGAYARGAAGPATKTPGASATRAIAVPTTLSGAEFTSAAGVTNPETKFKEGFSAPDFVPRVVVLDPSLAQATPEWLWLSTAIRSVDHAAEGYCAAASYPYLDQFFLGALRLFAAALRRTKADPADLEARSISQQAVWAVSGGMGRVPNGASHGLGYILGAGWGVPHGHTSCVLLPAVLQWNAAVNGDRQRAIAEALGRPEMSAAEAVRELVADLGQPTRLSDVGVTEADFERVAALGLKHPVVRANPRPIETQADILEILALAA